MGRDGGLVSLLTLIATWVRCLSLSSRFFLAVLEIDISAHFTVRLSRDAIAISTIYIMDANLPGPNPIKVFSASIEATLKFQPIREG